MARVTVEDCLQHCDNRFELVLMAARRARQIAGGGPAPKLDWDQDKPPVIALREIAEGLTGRDILQEQSSAPFFDDAQVLHQPDEDDALSG